MYSFNELKKACKLEVGSKVIKLAVLGNVSTQFLSKGIEGFGKLQNLNMQIFDADYNQIEEQLIDSDSEVYSFKPDYILLFFSTEKLYEEYLAEEKDSRKYFAGKYLEKIKNCWGYIEKNSDAKILQMNFTEIDDKILGQLSLKVDTTFLYQIRKLDYLLNEEMEKNSKVYPVDLKSIQIDLGRNQFFDSALYFASKMSISINAIPSVSKIVIDVIKSMSGLIKKCLVVDLDNTLWGGVIGDDGVDGIEIGHYGKGQVFTNLQSWIKELKEYGIIIAVCSKNEENIAKEPFEKNSEMVLKLNDISIFVANWEDKAQNIKLIKESLNIGYDSIVFLDDNPFERNLVREKLPDVEVPDLPEDVALWRGFLQNKNYFDRISYNDDKSDRTKFYQVEFERKKIEKSFESIDDYLISLNMKGSANNFDERFYKRIAELTERSNQFNLRTIRYKVDDIEKIAKSSEYITRYYTLEDKFGDSGLIAVVIMQKIQEGAFIDTFLMSCRVLKRGMEEFIVNDIVN
ncbi:MAG: HAD-IIIC family phosphatase, partial [Lachnospiraceae bacterium]|nr:HAD-IIIC family phosphatase [Lachnospiraceae bacterium]